MRIYKQWNKFPPYLDLHEYHNLINYIVPTVTIGKMAILYSLIVTEVNW